MWKNAGHSALDWNPSSVESKQRIIFFALTQKQKQKQNKNKKEGEKSKQKTTDERMFCVVKMGSSGTSEAVQNYGQTWACVRDSKFPGWRSVIDGPNLELANLLALGSLFLKKKQSIFLM